MRTIILPALIVSAAVVLIAVLGAAIFIAANWAPERSVEDLRVRWAPPPSTFIDVGGLKVHPEEVESVINRHPEVRMSLVYPRNNPITGAVVAADIVLRDNAPLPGTDPRASTLRKEILLHCRENLEQHKVPVTLRFVPALTVNASGKLVRHNA